MSLNRIDIMGRLTSDPVLRRTNSGKPVTSFTLAVDRDFTQGEVDFIDCVAWNNTAEFVNNYFAKGRMAVVSGRLQFREWTDKNGNKRRNAEVIADNVYFGDSKKDSAPSGESKLDSFSNYAANALGDGFVEVDDEETLPF